MHLLIYPVFLPLFASFLASLFSLFSKKLQVLTVLVFSVLHTAVSVYTAYSLLTGGPLTYELGNWAPPLGISLYGDALTAFFLLILAAGHFFSTLHKLSVQGFMSFENKTSILILLLFGALSGILLTADLFNLFVFLELATVCTIGLIAAGGKRQASLSAFFYLLISSLAAVFILIAIILLYQLTGTVNMYLIADKAGLLTENMKLVVFTLFFTALGLKAALFPFHLWQAVAYQSAGPYYAGILSAFGMKVYVYVILRLLLFPFASILAVSEMLQVFLVLACMSILFGHLMALRESNLVKLLAFSSVAHLGYIMLGIAAAGMQQNQSYIDLALAAALLHCAAHACMKSSLLFLAHSMERRFFSVDIRQLKGIAREAPLMTVIFCIGALSLTGIPPSGGFASKWFVAVYQISVWPVIILSTGTVLSLLYYTRCLSIFLSCNSDQTHKASLQSKKDVVFPCKKIFGLMVPLFLSALVFVSGFFGSSILQAFKIIVERSSL